MLASDHCQRQSLILYLEKMRWLANELAFIDSPISDEDFSMYVVHILGPEYNAFVVVLTTSTRNETISFANLHGICSATNFYPKPNILLSPVTWLPSTPIEHDPLILLYMGPNQAYFKYQLAHFSFLDLPQH